MAKNVIFCHMFYLSGQEPHFYENVDGNVMNM